MEDVFKFLFVAAIIIVGLVKQFKKEAKKSTGNGPAVPQPTVDNPLPEYWDGDTYGGFIPEGPKPEAPKPAPAYEAKQTHIRQSNEGTFVPSDTVGASFHRGSTPPNRKPSPPPQSMQPEPEETSEYAIQSAEEARRAIIWSEILQRKY